MKKILMSIVAVTLLSTAAVAQDNQNRRQGGQRMDPTEMIQRRTERVVQEYGLNDEQAKKLLELNTKFSGMMAGPRGGARQGGGNRGARQGGDGQRPARRDSARAGRPQGGFQGGPQGGQFAEQMQAYNEELQKILTPEQYKKYQEDQQNRMRNGFQRGGQRPQGGPRN